ncbi:arginine deiminase [Alteribacter natronophilus]|uniref:arginine deiminase n=1 Tax=Alteribacter natronophilus TaxID=2583810 RepID=UPI00110F1B22|nr:arginine deiminase [Alteribacter natronophilus]TMW70168.1 arginine deiminase [Alteribacter natronophilus]
MSDQSPFWIQSEIGQLDSVIVKRPGYEVENLTPDTLKRLLFDDIPYLPAIQREHDEFTKRLRERGTEVLYLEKLLAETLEDATIREQFLDQIITESQSDLHCSRQTLKEYLRSFSTDGLVAKVMGGVRKSEISQERKTNLYELMDDHQPFYLDPMPNLYFTRDPSCVIGNGISINAMSEPARRRESVFMDYIVRYHPAFAENEIPRWFDRTSRYALEGGDQLILNEETVAVGVSARTTPQAIEEMARNLFAGNPSFTRVVAVEIPKSRAFMHLDTVFTMVDKEQFTIHPAIHGPGGEMRIYVIRPGMEKGSVEIEERTHIVDTLKEVLNLSEVGLIQCGGGDEIAAAREQWNDGSNTLAIAPGVVVTYDRNYISNECLREAGIEVIEIPSSELSRGRGGPRCMSMPIRRKDL